LRAAQARGEVGASIDARAVARYFAMTIQGLSVLAKAYADQALLHDVVERMFATLDAFLGPEPVRLAAQPLALGETAQPRRERAQR
jgi:hypothetical protein